MGIEWFRLWIDDLEKWSLSNYVFLRMSEEMPRSTLRSLYGPQGPSYGAKTYDFMC